MPSSGDDDDGDDDGDGDGFMAGSIGRSDSS